MRYIHKNISEIARDPALRIYGIMLASLHILAFLHWDLVHPLVKILDPELRPAVCWPFFENCHNWRIFSASELQILLWGYLSMAIVTAILFTKPHLIPAGWYALLALNLFKSFFLFQDYRFRLNQHYMTYWVTLVFLLMPGKRRAIQYLVAAFYFWAGTLKFTPDWMSGAGLYGRIPLGIPDVLVPASCVYVIFLELVVVFGLFFRNHWIFWGAMLQFVAFHIASWPIVNFFYPTLMFAILSIFPLARYVRDPDHLEEKPPLGANLSGFLRFRERWTVYAVVAAFGILQLLPYAFPGDQALTGEGRLFALHMFDAPLQCAGWATIRNQKDDERKIRLGAKWTPARISCDPVVYFSVAKDLCNRMTKAGYKGKMDLHLRTRLWSEQQFRPVIEQPDFCGANIHYDLWKPNAWILK